jgi:large subunit ribosomal protein L18
LWEKRFEEKQGKQPLKIIVMKLTKKDRRLRIKNRIRKVLFGTTHIPRLTVFRSNKEIYASIINDELNQTICSTSSLSKSFKNDGNKIQQSEEVGKNIAKLALSKGVKECCFDRNGYLYHGRVKSLAESARKEGLKF